MRAALPWLLPIVAGFGAGWPARAQVAAVPPPVEQQTANCNAPVFATDQLVCGDPTLRALDSELAMRLAAGPAPTSRWIETQQQWFLRRSRCAFAEDHAVCTQSAYRERLTLLRPPGPSARLLKVSCDDADIWAIAAEADQTILLARAGSIIGRADNARNGSWRPFLTAEWRGRQVIMRTSDGASLKCRTRGVL